MRFRLAIAACLGVALITTAASAQSQHESSSRLLVLNGDSAMSGQANGVRILRGSSTPTRTAAAPRQDEVLGPGRWQAVAGERLWMFDQKTGKVAACRDRGTANVGEREIQCTFGTVSRYRRTFGNNFTH